MTSEIVRLPSTFPADEALNNSADRALCALQQALAAAGSEPLSAAHTPLFQQIALCSPFAASILTRWPEYCAELLDLDAVVQPLKAGQYSDFIKNAILPAAESDETLWMKQLRLIRQREMARIAICDLLGLLPLSAILQALSDLADSYLQVCVDSVYQALCEKHGVPVDDEGVEQHLIVLAMGKLGGGELNYSSDIDLIFFYPQAGMTQTEMIRGAEEAQTSIENQVFFTRLGQRVIRLLNDVTEEGFVFRVDMRLRPNGDSGPLVMNFNAMEIYYQSHGRDWERYAFIKARAVTGQAAHIEQFATILRPFVYRRYLDYGAFSALREMKSNIMQEVKRRGMRDNVKLGAGGIREIEFIGQAFQLIRGGREPVLQERSILKVLALLADLNLMEPLRFSALRDAYIFLRQTENRLQMVSDLQTHQLPSEESERARLAYAMGFETWEGFRAALKVHQQQVEECFADVFSFDEDDSKTAKDVILQQVWQGEQAHDELQARLRRVGVKQPEGLLTEIESFRDSYAVRRMTKNARQRLDQLMPLLISMLSEELSNSDELLATFRRITAFIKAVAKRSVYLALLSEYPSVLKQLVKLFAASSWLSEYLTRHPVLLDSLIDARILRKLPTKEKLRKRLKVAVQAVDKKDVELIMDLVRDFKHEMVLRVAAADIKKELPLMRVSDHLTELAEVMLEYVHQLAWAQLVEKYGAPACVVEQQRREPALAIIGYGKLGGIELAYGSDLDLVFLHNSDGTEQHTQGASVLDNDAFFMRMTQRIINMLGAQTASGQLYETDMRLRPDGASGLMVSSLVAFERYQLEKAWIWEHQALVRARLIIGGELLQSEFSRIRHKVLTQSRDIEKLRAEVIEMRQRMRKELSKSKANEFDLKHDAGGIVDIEFMVQYGVLAWACKIPELARYTDNIRILECFAEASILEPAVVEQLIDAYRYLRERGHRLALLGRTAIVEMDDELRDPIEHVKKAWREFVEDRVQSTS